ncbi:MAG TPA: hypothetical protein DCZ92_07135 [Elusimicrobia bacterium]|nr:hypothetical protein [Elusimicrobiota bacterium]
MTNAIEKLLEAASLPDNFDAFLRRIMATLRGADVLGSDAALVLVIAPGKNTPGFKLSGNIQPEERAALLGPGADCRRFPKEFITANIEGDETGGCLVARPGALTDRARAGQLLAAAAKAISGRLGREGRERLLTRERDTADSTTHLEEVFLSLPEMTLEEVSRAVLDEARRLTGSPFGFAGHIVPATGEFQLATFTPEAVHKSQAKDKGLAFKHFKGLWGWVLKNRQPLLTNDAPADPRSTGIPEGHIKITAFLGVPALAGETVLGMLALANAPAGYTEAELDTARKLARVYALALRTKLSESGKKAEEDKYRSLLNTLSDLIFNLNSEGTVLYTNLACERYGYTQQEVAGRHFSEFLHPEDRARVLSNFTKAVKTGIPSPSLSFRLLRKDGSSALMEQSSNLLKDPEKGVILVGSMRDLTEMDSARRLVSEAEEKYRVLFNNANTAAFIADIKTGLLVDVNKDAEALTGRTREELIGMHQSKLHPPQLLSRYKEVFRDHSTSPKSRLDTGVVIRKDGSQVPVIIRGSTIRLGERTFLQGIFTDISALKNTEARLQDIVQKNPMAIQIVDKDGFTISVNLAHTRLFGSIPPPGYSVFNDPQLKKRGFDKFIARIKKGLVAHIPDIPYNAHEADPKAPDITIWLKTIIFPLAAGGGKPERFVIMHEDITQGKLAEKQFREAVTFNKNIMDSARDGIIVLDKDMRCRVFSSAMEEIFGVRPKAALGRRPLEFLPFLKEAGIAKRLAAILDGKEVPTQDFRFFNKKTRKEGWASANSHALRDSSGRITGIVGVIRDITETRKNDEKYQALVESTDTGYLILDDKGRVVDANAEYLRLTGRKEMSEIMYRRVTEWTAPHDRARNRLEVQKCLKKGFVRGLTVDYQSPDGTIIPVDVNATVVKTPDSFQIISLCRDISGRRRAEAALKLSEEKYRTIFEASSDPIFVHDVKGRILSVNAAASQIYGYSRRQLTRMRVSQVDTPEEAVHIEKRIKTLLEKGFVSFETVHRARDGRRFAVEARVKSTVWEGAPAILSVCRDISARKAVEDALRESEQRYRQLVENLGGNYFFYRHDTKGVFTYVSPTITGMLGYSREEFFRHFSSYLTPNPINKEVTRHTLASLRGIQQLPYEVEIFHKDGSIRRLEVTETPLRDAGDKVIGVEGLAHDITAQKKTAEVIRESEARYHTLFDMAADGIFILSTDGASVMVNNSFARMHGYAGPAEMAHLRLQDLDAPESAKLAPGRLRKIIALSGKPLHFEVEHYHKNGHVFPLSVSCNLVTIGGKPHFLSFTRDITEHRRDEAEMKEYAALLKAQQEASPDAILVVDEDGKIKSFNRRFAEMWKLPAKVLATRSDKLAIKAVLGQLCEPGKFLKRVEYLYKHPGEESHEEIALKDGRVVERFSTAVVGEDGRYYGRTWHFHDITGRRRAADLLADSEKKFRTLVEASFDMIYLIGRDDTILYMNPAAIRHLGRKPAEVIGRQRGLFFPPQAAAHQKLALDRVFSTGEPVSSESEIKGGKREAFLETNLVPIKDAGGEVLQVLGISRDVTERRRLQNVLKDSEETLRAVFDTAKDAIFIKDLRGRYLKMNKACAELFKIDQEKAPGKTDHDIFPPEIAEDVIKDDREVLRTGKPLTRTYDRVLPSGKYYFHTVKTPLRDPSGRITGVLGIARDITELKKMEAELALSHAIEAVSREARPMAHDFNNVLAAINGYATMIDDELKASDPIKGEIGQIIHAVRRAADLTSKFQNFARNPQLPRHPGGDADKKRK